MLSSKEEVITDYSAAVKKAEDRLTVMVNTQQYLERQMEECQAQLQELSMKNPTGEDEQEEADEEVAEDAD